MRMNVALYMPQNLLNSKQFRTTKEKEVIKEGTI